ncbi:hypothetical protein BT69DRAFT_1281954 [Atractiella rhizophila]|nr:hypothetical protein BT69DRAFT_1281954 [Atractiella rhizophila]
MIILSWKVIRDNIDGIMDLVEKVMYDEDVVIYVHPITLIIARLYLLFLQDIKMSNGTRKERENATFVLQFAKESHYFLNLLRAGGIKLLPEVAVDHDSHWHPFLHRSIQEVAGVVVAKELYLLPRGVQNSGNAEQTYNDLISFEESLLSAAVSQLQRANFNRAIDGEEHIRRIIRLYPSEAFADISDRKGVDGTTLSRLLKQLSS